MAAPPRRGMATIHLRCLQKSMGPGVVTAIAGEMADSGYAQLESQLMVGNSITQTLWFRPTPTIYDRGPCAYGGNAIGD